MRPSGLPLHVAPATRQPAVASCLRKTQHHPRVAPCQYSGPASGHGRAHAACPPWRSCSSREHLRSRPPRAERVGDPARSSRRSARGAYGSTTSRRFLPSVSRISPGRWSPGQESQAGGNRRRLVLVAIHRSARSAMAIARSSAAWPAVMPPSICLTSSPVS